jgi:glycolate oxidase FAD binding subunit
MTLQPLIDQVRAAAANGTPLRIRGGGSKDFYGQTLQGEMLDTRGFSGITIYEPSELVVTARAGTPLAELEATLADKGQCLPFEPPHYPISSTDSVATVGGMVASALSGPARATAGGVRDYMLGVQILNGRAELLTFGGQVMKNVAGYDVSRLMAGSMGTLGVITEVSLKVLPVPPAEATVRFHLDEATALRKLNEWAGQPLPLNASSWVVDAGQPTLYLRLRGAVAAVDAAMVRLLKEVPGERVDSPQTIADWAAARDLRLPWFTTGFARGDDLWRLSVPQTAGPLDVGDTMIDWLGGQRWVWAASGDVPSAQKLRAAAQSMGGNATLFVAAQAESKKVVAVFDPLKPPLDTIHQRLKAEFDPANIFGRNRLYPAVHPSL